MNELLSWVKAAGIIAAIVIALYAFWIVAIISALAILVFITKSVMDDY